MSSYQIVKKVRDNVIVQLRNNFALDTRYTYNDDPVTTQIMIHDVTPNEPLKIPSIIINTVSVGEMRYLDDDFLGESETGLIRSTGLNSNTTIEILTLDTITRDELIDRVYELLKSFKDTLADAGIAVYTIDFSPERRQFIGDRWFYTSGVTMKCYSEWQEDTVVETVTGVKTTPSTIPFIEGNV